MAYKMTKRGSLDNEITYEFFCDTIADMNAIENTYRTLGSIAVVLEGDGGGLEIYITNSQREWTALNISTGESSSTEIDEEAIAEIIDALLENNETINSLSEISETVSEDADTASEAATRATNAASSALGSANSAASSASSAATAANNASSSASQAGSYASAASTSASTAAAKATEAKNSAESAVSAGASAVSATQTAYQHASSAQNSATTASQAATSALNSAQAAQTALESITQDNSELAEDIEEIKNEKANKIGHYEELTVGLADQLTSTVSIFDNVPYNFRTSGGSIDIGNRKDEQKIVGGGVFWHQMAPESSTNWGNTNCNITINNRQIEIVPATDDAIIKYLWMPMHEKHKILVTGTFIHSASTTGIYVGLWRNSFTDTDNYISRKYIQYIDIMEPTDFKYIFSSEGDNEVSLRFELTEGINTQDKITIKNLQIFDLTIMFGDEIASYIYNLEQTTTGAGVAWFRKLFPKSYYEFFEGDYSFVRPQGYKTIGFNQWDEEWENGYYASGTKMNSSNRIRSKNKIHVIPSTKYYINTQYELEIQEYDANQEFIKTSLAYQEIITTTNKTHYITFSTNLNSTSTYDYPICINLSWDGERDGEYEPYESYSYTIDSNIGVLYGIPKLDENNQLYYDGDELKSDGTVTYRYDEVDLGTLAWDYSTAYNRFTSAAFSPIKKPENNDGIVNIMCAPFRVVSANDTKNMNDDFTVGIASSGSICIRCSSFTDRIAFKQAMSGVYLIYEVATPSYEYFEPFTTTQVVNDFGTEELIDTRAIPIPIGHETNYMANLKAKLEMMPNSPDGNGDYIVRQVDGENEYVPLNIPIATNSQLGVVKGNSYGIRVNATGDMYINAASISSEIKPGISNYLPIVPSNQHASAFYGLAKAAGDTTQASSSNSVGVYTNEAKTAIQTMLDVPSKSYVDTKIPTAPVADGTYTLQVTVTNGSQTYSWVSTGA